MTIMERIKQARPVVILLLCGGMLAAVLWAVERWRALDRLLTLFESGGRMAVAYLAALAIGLALVVLAFRPVAAVLSDVWLSLLRRPPFNQFWQPRVQATLAVVSLLAAIGLFWRAPFAWAFAIAASIVCAYFLAWHDQPRKLFLLALVILAGYLAPYLILGPDCHIKIYDNLDCHIVQAKLLAASGKAFCLTPGARLDPMMNGIYLSCIDSGYSVIVWLFMLFKPFTVYVLNEIMMRVIAFAGMLLLLRRSWRAGMRPYWVDLGAALAFALLPFYWGGGLSVAGLPLLLHVFIEFSRGRGRPFYWALVLIFPFYSKLAQSGFFICLVLAAWLVFLWLRQWRFPWRFGAALTILGGGYALSHFQLIYATAFPYFVSIREHFVSPAHPLGVCIKLALKNFVFDTINEPGAQQCCVLAAAAAALWVVARKRARQPLLIGLVAFVMANAVLWGFKYWAGFTALYARLPFLQSFNFARFYWFNPFVWCLIFALALGILAKLKAGRSAALLLLIGQILFLTVYYQPEIRFRLGRKVSLVGPPVTYQLSFAEYYAQPLFERVRVAIGKPQSSYRVASIGIHPAISQYNGFYTIDGYFDLYPLAYRERMVRLMDGEFAKMPQIRSGFLANSRRCVVHVAAILNNLELQGDYNNRGIVKTQDNLKIDNLQLDRTVFKELGGEYLLSALEIKNSRAAGFDCVGVFDDAAAPWRIYLYRVL